MKYWYHLHNKASYINWPKQFGEMRSIRLDMTGAIYLVIFGSDHIIALSYTSFCILIQF